MKTRNKRIWFTLGAAVMLAATAFGLAACGGKTPAKADVTGAYITMPRMAYANMRPTYNYYTVTYTFQQLTTYSDGTYCLAVSSSTFSALELPEEGSGGKGNARDTSLTYY
ncbi:MAG: hypothetical protein LBL66_08630 [Clostridiales bacterium]|jgi:hypothetical protein|nr:hypothetical protein [Clostridiales bacterium]